MPTATKTKRPRKASAPKDKHLTRCAASPAVQGEEDVKEDQRELQRTAALQTMREEFATLNPAQFDSTRPGIDIYAWDRHQRIVAKYRAAMKAIG